MQHGFVVRPSRFVLKELDQRVAQHADPQRVDDSREREPCKRPRSSPLRQRCTAYVLISGSRQQQRAVRRIYDAYKARPTKVAVEGVGLKSLPVDVRNARSTK